MVKRHWQIILFNILIILCFILGYGRFGDVIFDSFREMYIPEQMLQGQVLYKNIFNIYAPFAYLFNALLLKVFGNHLSVLYTTGLVAALGISNLIFAIAKKFVNKNYSLGIVLIFISTSILSPNAFNCFFPYSYGMLYGLLFILGSIYFALNKKYTPAFALYSFAICSKYEFILLLPLLIYAAGRKNLWKNILALILPAIITFLPLFVQGVGLENILISYKITLSMGATKTLYWFYSVTGLVFRPELIPIYGINLAKIAVPIALMYFVKSYYIVPIVLVYCRFISTPELFIYIFPLLLVLFIFKRKSLNLDEKFFVFASFLVSMKIFFATTIQSYGIYFIPFAIISLFILLPQKLKKSAMIVLLLCALCFGIKNIKVLHSKSVKLQTTVGTVYTIPYNGNSIKELLNYVQNNTDKDAEVLVYPECLSVNVLAERKSDNKFYSLIPLYIETFGEELILKRFEFTKPEYIVISNIDTSSYYYTHFGTDYADEIYSYIVNNYNKEVQFGEGLFFTVFKRKN